MAELRKSGEEKWIRPDSKTQVTAEHQIVGGAIVPIRVHTIVISVQHSDDISNEDMRAILKEKVIFCNSNGITPIYYFRLSTMSYQNSTWTAIPFTTSNHLVDL